MNGFDLTSKNSTELAKIRTEFAI